jgi:hypothetical protein
MVSGAGIKEQKKKEKRRKEKGRKKEREKGGCPNSIK